MHEWTREPLVNVAEIRPSNVDKKSNTGEQPVWLCNYMDVYTREYITKDIQFMEATATSAEIQRFRVERGDVLITKDSETPDDIGIPAVVLDDIDNLVCGYHVALLKTKKDRVDPVYLSKQLATTETSHYFSRLANGSTRYGLSFGSIAATPIRLAPLPQQQRIAEILSTLDEAIEQTEALIAKTQKIKAGLMHDLFTRGITLDGQLRRPREEAPQLYKEFTLGWIPKEWQIAGGAMVADLITKGESPGWQGFEYQESGVLFVTSENVRDGFLEIDNPKFIPEAFDRKLYRSRLAPGDVLINLVGASIGRSCQVPDGMLAANINQAVCLYRVRDRALADWAAMYFAWPVTITRLIGEQVETARANLSLSDLRRFEIPIPSEGERKKLVKGYWQINTALQEQLSSLGKLHLLKAGLMQDLLTGRVRVPTAEVAELNKVEANV